MPAPSSQRWSKHRPHASPPIAPHEAPSSTWSGPCVGGEGCRDSDGARLPPQHGEPFPASAAPP
eukprot:3177138-Pleurochrysis_carterae.AAC.1